MVGELDNARKFAREVYELIKEHPHYYKILDSLTTSALSIEDYANRCIFDLFISELMKFGKNYYDALDVLPKPDAAKLLSAKEEFIYKIYDKLEERCKLKRT